MISKRNARNATIGGIVFRYKVSTTPKSRGVYDLNITVQSVADNGRKLIVVGLIQKDPWIRPLLSPLVHWECPTVTRHEIEWLVREAIGGGWDFSTKGADFVLEASNEIFRCGFLAAQVGRTGEPRR
ncbi:hypothetical protein OKA05_20655 [Luteolibacter arcticus]|uniref:Uncharacterized protein n=1 Tax=Luteolibacter arcticus TaxID=1581411 RepID=A0ABT3GND1_9BACT|nr:hypothetical protein [Luteolibacter arcticus]MCW1924986.1 hypothetical protein [Luteolibacter arcticus]